MLTESTNATAFRQRLRVVPPGISSLIFRHALNPKLHIKAVSSAVPDTSKRIREVNREIQNRLTRFEVIPRLIEEVYQSLLLGCGAGGSRTPVQTREKCGFYMFSLVLVFDLN